jgi:hypothetical protein
MAFAKGRKGWLNSYSDTPVFHFTLALIEIALFKAPAGYIARPRVLARTTNIERGIATLNEGKITISSGGVSQTANGREKPTTITQERYFEQLERVLPGVPKNLTAFTDQLARAAGLRSLGVNP